MLVLVRYGETEKAARKILSGQSDDCLTDAGRETACQYTEALAGVVFDTLYCAISKPANKTARLIAAHQSKVVIHDVDDLREPSGGLYEGRPYLDLKRELPPRQYRLWDRDYFNAPPEGESMADLTERVLTWVRKQKQAGLWSGNILIVVGPAVMKVLLGHFQSMEESDIIGLEPFAIPYSFDQNGS